ncbi:hypothetical protein ABTL57_19230, partial [Acinetobacter baumannii]
EDVTVGAEFREETPQDGHPRRRQIETDAEIEAGDRRLCHFAIRYEAVPCAAAKKKHGACLTRLSIES